MVAPANHLQGRASALTLSDFHAAARQAKGRPLEINRGQVLASPLERRGFSGRVYRFFRGIGEALKIFNRQERVTPADRQARQALANRHFQSLASIHGVPLSQRERPQAREAALTGRQVLQVMDAAAAKHLACQREVMDYLEKNPELELRLVRESLERQTGRPLSDLLEQAGASGASAAAEQTLRDSPLWTEYRKNLQGLLSNLSFRVSESDAESQINAPLSHLRGLNEDEIQSAVRSAAGSAPAFAGEPDQADLCSLGFQQAEQSITRFFQEAAGKNPYPKNLSHALIKFRLGLEKASLKNPMDASSRSHAFNVMIERGLSQLSDASLSQLKNNLKQGHPAVLGFIAGIDSYHEMCPSEEEEEALDFVETMNDVVRLMNVNKRLASSMPNVLSEVARMANQRDSGEQNAASSDAVDDNYQFMQFQSALRNTRDNFQNRLLDDNIAAAYQDFGEAHAQVYPQEAARMEAEAIAATGAVEESLESDAPPADLKARLSEQADKVSDKLEQAAGKVSEKLEQAAGKVSEKVEQAAGKVSEKVEQAAGKVSEKVERAVERHQIAKAADELSKKITEEKAIDERLKTEQTLVEKGSARLSREKTDQYLEKKEQQYKQREAQRPPLRKAQETMRQAASVKHRRRKESEKFLRHYEVGSGMRSGEQPYAAAGGARHSQAEAPQRTAAQATPAQARTPVDSQSATASEVAQDASSPELKKKVKLPSQETEV